MMAQIMCFGAYSRPSAARTYDLWITVKQNPFHRSTDNFCFREMSKHVRKVAIASIEELSDCEVYVHNFEYILLNFTLNSLSKSPTDEIDLKIDLNA